MPIYKVELRRTCWESATIEVRADAATEAYDEAYETVEDSDFEEWDNEITVEGVELISDDDDDDDEEEEELGLRGEPDW